MRTTKILFLLIGIFLFEADLAKATTFGIALAGDSLTNCVQYYFNAHFWDNTGYEPRFWDGSNYVPPFVYVGETSPRSPWAIPGQNTSHFVGKIPVSELGAPADYHYEHQEITDLYPDFVIFMLGTNDVYNDSNADYYFSEFKANIDEIFSNWNQNSLPHVIIASILPQIGSGRENADWRITNWYNPYLHVEAFMHGFDYLDVNYLIRTNPNMLNYYHTDGVHLSAQGYYWLAARYTDELYHILTTPDINTLTLTPGECLCFDCVIADNVIIGENAKLTINSIATTIANSSVPEPTNFILLSMGFISLFARTWRRRRMI
jgi:hypothetical protein